MRRNYRVSSDALRHRHHRSNTYVRTLGTDSYTVIVEAEVLRVIATASNGCLLWSERKEHVKDEHRQTQTIPYLNHLKLCNLP